MEFHFRRHFRLLVKWKFVKWKTHFRSASIGVVFLQSRTGCYGILININECSGVTSRPMRTEPKLQVYFYSEAKISAPSRMYHSQYATDNAFTTRQNNCEKTKGIEKHFRESLVVPLHQNLMTPLELVLVLSCTLHGRAVLS